MVDVRGAWGVVGGGALVLAMSAPAMVRADEWRSPPTRFQICQFEISTQKGQRSQLLRDCLSRRAEGERLIGRDCRRQVASIAGAARMQAQKECEERGYAMPTDQMPKRPPPPPKPAEPAGGADAGAAAAAPPPLAPAAGERSN